MTNIATSNNKKKENHASSIDCKILCKTSKVNKVKENTLTK